MTVVKKYNSGTSQWEAVVVGKQGPPALLIQTSEPASTNVLWLDTDAVSANSSISSNLIDARGDLIVGSAADSAARLAVGATNGQALVVDSAQTLGVKWEAHDNLMPISSEAFVKIGATSNTIPANTSAAPMVQSLVLPRPTPITGVTINVTTAQAGSQFVICLYSAGSDGLPDALLASGVVDTSTTGYKTASVNLIVPTTVFVGGYGLTTGTQASLTCVANNIFTSGTWQGNYQSVTSRHSGYIGPANPGTTNPPATFTATSTSRWAPIVWLVA